LSEELKRDFSVNHIFPCYNNDLFFINKFIVYFENKDEIEKLNTLMFSNSERLCFENITEKKFVDFYFILNHIFKNCDKFDESVRTVKITICKKEGIKNYDNKKENLIKFLKGIF
jgi:hypothetical protein